MGSAIGDYIHLSAKNYISYGNARGGSGGGFKKTGIASAEASILFRQRDLEKENKSLKPTGDIEKLKEDIKNGLSYFFNEKNNGQQIYDAVWKTVEDEIQKRAEKQFTKVKIDRSTGLVIRDASTINSNVAMKSKAFSQKERINIKTIDKTFENIGKKLANLGNKNVKKLDEQLTLLKNTFKKMKKNIVQTEKGFFRIADLENSGYSSFLNDVNVLRAATLASLMTTETGTLLEMLIAAVPLYIQKIAGEKLEDFQNKIEEWVKKQVTGQDRANITYQPSDFPKKLRKNAAELIEKIFSGSNYRENKLDNNGAYIIESVSRSQIKIDAEIVLNSGKALVSAKNVNLNNFSGEDIHLVDKSPLLSLLASEQGKHRDFVNHFLNLNSKHYINKGKDEDETIQSSYADTIKRSREIMRQVLFLKAIAGSRGQKANLFVIHNTDKNAKQPFIVKTIEEIVSQVVGKDTLYDILFSNIGSFNIKSTIPIFENRFSSTAWDRIAGVLKQAQNIKVSAMIKKDAFTKDKV